MKAVLRSIKPYWLYLILTGKKTVEIGKSCPQAKDWNKVVEMYCSKDMRSFNRIPEKGREWMCKYLGKVIGEFICDRIDRIEKRGINNNFDYCYLSLNEWGNDDIEIEIKDIQKSCISKSELNAYGENSSCLYGLHITDLKIYDKPKELREFYKPCPDPFNYCTTCKHCIRIIPPDEEEYALYHGGQFDYWEEHCMNNLTRPPQSWCYVQELEDSNDQ